MKKTRSSKFPKQFCLASILFGSFYYMPIPQLFSTSAYAHGDHKVGKPINADAAKTTAKHTVSGIIKQGKLDKVWDKILANKPVQKDFGHGKEWVITFDNLEAKDKKKKKLFVFLRIDGKVLGVNFTGN